MEHVRTPLSRALPARVAGEIDHREFERGGVDRGRIEGVSDLLLLVLAAYGSTHPMARTESLGSAVKPDIS